MGLDMMKEAAFETGKLSIHYAEGPDSGPALVLLHGGSARWQYFEDIIPDLAARYHLYALDLRGHGKSGRVAWGYTLRDYTEDVTAFLKEVSGPACLFGHSLGGGVALMAARDCPDFVRAVIVGDSPLDAASWKAGTNEAKLHQLRVWRALAGGTHPVEEIIAALKDTLIQDPGQDQPVRMRDLYGEDSGVFAHLAVRLYDIDPDMLGILIEDFDSVTAGYEIDTLLPAILCPVLLLQADPQKGSAMTDEDVSRAMGLLKKGRHVRMTGLSHLLFVEDQERVLREVEEFMGQEY